ncbi:MAG: hypothetical protein ACYDBQ_09500 [Thermoplasmatota archaeon]
MSRGASSGASGALLVDLVLVVAAVASYLYVGGSSGLVWGLLFLALAIARRLWMWRRTKAPRPRQPRVHPYRAEASTPAENRWPAARVTLFWGALATLMVLIGTYLDRRFNPDPTMPNPLWVGRYTLLPLFGGLALLGFGFFRATWTKRVTMVGWILFAFYWSLTAFDLLYAEGQDYVNFSFALVGTYFFTYLAYHEWLSMARGVDNDALHFLNVSTFVAAGAYFVIDKVEAVRYELIKLVSNQTDWLLRALGQGSPKGGLVYLLDPSYGAPSVAGEGPARFFYNNTYNTCPDGASGAGLSQADFTKLCLDHSANFMHTFWQKILHFAPDGDHMILPVSIILACTALQSIMLFVGLCVGTRGKPVAKLVNSLWVGLTVYLLNLLRNTGIIWFYGQGDASFWVMHNAVGKGGSLVAMVFIAFLLFRVFPPFFESLVQVLDLPDRDGPVERTLRFGRRRPPMPS